MSSNQEEQTSIEDEARKKFEPARGSVPQQLDVSEGEHPIREALGKSSHRKLKAHEGTLGERFAFRYSRSEAFVREYLANAETGCIRAARFELKQIDTDTYNSDWFSSHSIPELLDEAREVAGYYPVIEIHTSPQGASMDRFTIEDNGIGISVSEFVGLRELGLSASHDEGTQLGQFGQGVMSVFNAVGEYGVLNLTTYSRKDGANYRERFRITGFNDLPGTRDSFGTTWRIPAFSEEAADMDVGEAIEEYTTAMYVPVIHYTHDESGTLQGKEEYTYTPLKDLVDENEPAFVYEDEYVEAVMSPSISSPKTFLVSQPIERGCSTSTFDAPAKFHLRIKKENGCIYKSTHDDRDNTGLIPVSDDRYENELIKDKEAIHDGQVVPGDIVAYDLDGYDNYVVPSGVDDELVETMDGVETIDRSEVDYLSTNPEWNPFVIDGPHKGFAFVSEDEWNQIPTDINQIFVPYNRTSIPKRKQLSGFSIDKDEIPSGFDIPLLQPVDDRDRFEDHDGAMVKAVSKELNRMLLEEAEELYELFAQKGFDVFYEFTDHERDVFTVVFEEFINNGSNTSALVVGQNVSDLFGVTLSSFKSEQLSNLSNTVEHAPRDSMYPNKTQNRRKEKISTIIRKVGSDGTVYMGSTVHADKATLAWALHDRNHVIAVDGAHMYDDYSKLFGWVPLKELSLRNIAEKYDVSDDVAEKLERAKRSGGTGGVSLDDLEASTREIKVRTNKERSYTSKTPKEIKDAFDQGDRVRADGANKLEHLLVFPEPDVHGVGIARDACGGSIGRAIVPKYVAEYLEDVDNCYLCEKGNYMDAMYEIRESMLSGDVDVVNIGDLLGAGLDDDGKMQPEYDPSDDASITTETVTYGDLGDEAIGVVLDDTIRGLLEADSGIDNGRVYETLTEVLVGQDALTTETTRLVILDPHEVDNTLLVWNPNREDLTGVKLVRHTNSRYNNDWNAEKFRPKRSMKIDLLFPNDRFPRETQAWDTIIENNSYSIRKGHTKGQSIIDTMHHLAKHVPDDVPVLPGGEENSS